MPRHQFPSLRKRVSAHVTSPACVRCRYGAAAGPAREEGQQHASGGGPSCRGRRRARQAGRAQPGSRQSGATSCSRQGERGACGECAGRGVVGLGLLKLDRAHPRPAARPALTRTPVSPASPQRLPGPGAGPAVVKVFQRKKAPVREPLSVHTCCPTPTRHAGRTPFPRPTPVTRTAHLTVICALHPPTRHAAGATGCGRGASAAPSRPTPPTTTGARLTAATRRRPAVPPGEPHGPSAGGADAAPRLRRVHRGRQRTRGACSSARRCG